MGVRRWLQWRGLYKDVRTPELAAELMEDIPGDVTKLILKCNEDLEIWQQRVTYEDDTFSVTDYPEVRKGVHPDRMGTAYTIKYFVKMQKTMIHVEDMPDAFDDLLIYWGPVAQDAEKPSEVAGILLIEGQDYTVHPEKKTVEFIAMDVQPGEILKLVFLVDEEL